MKKLLKLLVDFYRENTKIATIYAIAISALLIMFIFTGALNLSENKHKLSENYDKDNIIDNHLKELDI